MANAFAAACLFAAATLLATSASAQMDYSRGGNIGNGNLGGGNLGGRDFEGLTRGTRDLGADDFADPDSRAELDTRLPPAQEFELQLQFGPEVLDAIVQPESASRIDRQLIDALDAAATNFVRGDAVTGGFFRETDELEARYHAASEAAPFLRDAAPGASIEIVQPDAFAAKLELLEKVFPAGTDLAAVPIAVDGQLIIKVGYYFNYMRAGDPVDGETNPPSHPMSASSRPPGMAIPAAALETPALHAKVGGMSPNGDTTLACTAIRLTPQIALTAAHCACSVSDWQISFTANTALAQEPPTRASVLSIFGGEARCDACPDGNCKASFFDAPDIALLTLHDVGSATFTPPLIAQPSHYEMARAVYYVGYGTTLSEALPNTNTVRRMAYEDVISPDCVAGEPPYSPCHAGFETFTYRARTGACKGDSGGVGIVTLADGRDVIASLISREAQRTETSPVGCGHGTTATLLYEASVLAFLRQHVPDLSQADAALATYAMVQQ